MDRVATANAAPGEGGRRRAGRRAQLLPVLPVPASDRLLAWLLAAILVWAPWPIGSNRPWSWSLLALLLTGLLLAWSLCRLRDGVVPPLPRALVLAIATTLLAWGWILLQTVPLAVLPLPAGWAHPAWGWAAAAGIAGLPRIGLDPEAAMVGLMRLMSYGAAFWLAFALGSEPRLARRLLWAVLVAAALSAGYGLLLELSGAGFLFWGQARVQDAVTGTFINRNNFATFANLGLLAGAGLLLAELLRMDRQRSPLLLLAGLIERQMPLLLLLLVLLSASLLSASRGGALSLAAAMLLLLALTMRLLGRRLPWHRLLLGTGLVLLLALGAVQFLGGRAVVERMGQIDRSQDVDPGSGGRIAVWGVGLALVAERPWLGHGLGSFPAGFERLRDERFPLPYDKAHDTYLEHAVELGLPATLLLYLGPVLIAVACLRATFERRRSQIFPAVAATATLLVGVHALVDFSLQIPAVALAYAVLLGLGAAQIRSQRRGAGGTIAEGEETA